MMKSLADGAQDVYLTGQPRITFFKVIYRRFTNYSTECFDADFDFKIYGSTDLDQKTE